MIQLHGEQQYIIDIGRRLGIEIKILQHDRATVTCAEKAELLGRSVDRVVKALYFHTGDYSDPMIGIITPELGSVDFKKIFGHVLGIDVKAAKRYSTNGYMPSGMSKGTCTPFPAASAMEIEIGKLIIVEHPPIQHAVVDISLGDYFDEPLKVSMHIPYSGICAILKEKFGEDKILTYQPR